MAYDGVVLLVVADLVCAYQGRQQQIILLAAMLGLYMITNYNLAALQMKVVPLFSVRSVLCGRRAGLALELSAIFLLH